MAAVSSAIERPGQNHPIQSAAGILDQWGPIYEFPIERGKVLEFVESIYCDHPHYLDNPKGPIPLSYLSVAGYRWGYMLEHPRGTHFDGIDEPWQRSIDGGQSFAWQDKPAEIGDVLNVRTRLVEAIRKKSRRYSELRLYRTETEFAHRDGTVVAIWTACSILPGQSDNCSSEAHEIVNLPYVDDNRARAISELAALRALPGGAIPPPVTLPPLSRTEIARYQFGVGDSAPFHHDSRHASTLGMPDVMSIGMLQAGAMLSYLANWLGPRRVCSFAVQFVAPVWPGDVLRISLKGPNHLVMRRQTSSSTAGPLAEVLTTAAEFHVKS